MDPSKFVSSREASKHLKVSAVTLRRWEKSGNIECIRTPTGQRRYRIDNIMNQSFLDTTTLAELRQQAETLRQENETLRQLKVEMDERIAQLEAKLEELKEKTNSNKPKPIDTIKPTKPMKAPKAT